MFSSTLLEVLCKRLPGPFAIPNLLLLSVDRGTRGTTSGPNVSRHSSPVPSKRAMRQTAAGPLLNETAAT